MSWCHVVLFIMTRLGDTFWALREILSRSYSMLYEGGSDAGPCIVYDPYVWLSVCPSRADIVSKRRKIGPQNLYRRMAQGFCSQDLQGSSRSSKGFTPIEGVKWEWGRENWLFGQWVAVCQKRCKIGPRLLLITNRSRIYGLSIGAKINDLGWPCTAITHCDSKCVFRSPPRKFEWR